MGNVNLLRTYSSSSSAHSRLVRSSVLNCWGSNQKVRHSFGNFIGFSVPAALVGFGIHQSLKDNSDTIEVCSNSRRKRNLCQERYLEGRIRRFFRGVTLSKNYPAIDKKCTQGGGGGGDRVTGLPFFNATIKSFNLLTPVSCEPCSSEEADGEDVICECSCIQQKLPFTKGETSCPTCDSCNCNRDSNENSVSGGGGSSTNDRQSAQNDDTVGEKVEEKQQQSTSFISSLFPSSSCPPPPPRKKNPCTGGNTTTVSNKPCRSQHCSQAMDIDIDAISKGFGGVNQIDFIIDSDLSHCFLIKQASQVTVDSVTRILTETAAAYDDYHAEYRRAIDMMMDTLEESRRACGADLEVIECKLLIHRAKLDDWKRRLAELDMFISSLEKLGFAAAETAFMGNAEYASVAMSERVNSLVLEIKRLREISREKERDMLELQSLIIVETGKHLK